MPVVCGVDSSTQSCTVELRDAEDGRLLGRGRAPHPPVTPPVAEQDPQAWWDAFGAARSAAVAAAGLRDLARDGRAGPGGAPGPEATYVAAQQHGLVVTDHGGRPLRPAKLWCDTTSAPDAVWLVDHHPDGAAGWAAACGTVPVPSLTITKLSWLHRREPEVFDAMRRVMLPHDWLAWRAGGPWGTDRGDASGTGWWSPAEGRYRPDLLAIVDGGLDWEALLPPVAAPAEAGGTGDNMAGALGAALGPGDVLVSLGTSGVVCARSDRPTADPTGAVAGFADATGGFLPLVCTLNATKVTDTVARLLGADHRRLDRLALEAEPGAGGLVLVPYLDGERTPNRPEATGTLRGLRSDATPEALARAAFEGVCCGLLDGLDALAAAGVATGGRMVLVGGGARSGAYRQVLADLAGRPVEVPAEPDLVVAGAAAAAAARLLGRPVDEVTAAWGLPGPTMLVEPRLHPDRAAELRARYAAARDLP